MISLLLLALSLQAPPSGVGEPWVPAETGTQDCGMDAHRHAYDVDEHHHIKVNREKGEPDIVFDGLCHDNNTEKVCRPTGTGECVDPSRKVLPVPKGE
jgi:hypothetical protein